MSGRPKRTYARVRHKDDSSDSGGWWMESAIYMGCLAFVNTAGGYQPQHGSNLVVLERVRTRGGLRDLDWSRTAIANRTFEQAGAGWMDRAGRLHPCLYGEHSQYADCVLKKRKTDPECPVFGDIRGERVLDDEGWVKIWCRPGKKPPFSLSEWTCPKRLSAEQRNAMSAIGYKLHDYD